MANTNKEIDLKLLKEKFKRFDIHLFIDKKDEADDVSSLIRAGNELYVMHLENDDYISFTVADDRRDLTDRNIFLTSRLNDLLNCMGIDPLLDIKYIDGNKIKIKGENLIEQFKKFEELKGDEKAVKEILSKIEVTRHWPKLDDFMLDKIDKINLSEPLNVYKNLILGIVWTTEKDEALKVIEKLIMKGYRVSEDSEVLRGLEYWKNKFSWGPETYEKILQLFSNPPKSSPVAPPLSFSALYQSTAARSRNAGDSKARSRDAGDSKEANDLGQDSVKDASHDSVKDSARDSVNNSVNESDADKKPSKDNKPKGI